MRGFKKSAALLIALVLVGAMGCAAMKPATPGGPPAPTDDQTVTIAGAFGLACGAAPLALKHPGDVAKAQKAVAAAAAVLNEDAPSLEAVKRALAAAGLNEQWQTLTATAIEQLRSIIGASGTGVLARESVAFRATAAFLDVCSATLGTGGAGV